MSCNQPITGSQSIKWFRNSVEINGATTNMLTISLDGMYKAIVTNSSGCFNEDEINVTTQKAPVVELGSNIDKCDGENVTLNAGTDGVKYTWFRDDIIINGATQNTYKPLQSGIYRVLVENAATCTKEDQVVVKFFAAPEILPLPAMETPCIGSAFSINAMATGYQTLQWYLNNSIIVGATELTLPILSSGNYKIIATNNIGCKTEQSTIVDFKSLPVINLGPDEIACAGQSVELNAGTQGIEYKWQKNSTLLSNTSSKLQVTESALYKVTVTSSFGCSATAQKNVTFIAGPSVELNGDKSICEGEIWPIIVTTNASNANFIWSRNGVILQSEISSTLNVMLEGSYTVIVNGGVPPCNVTKTVNIMVNDKPKVDLGIDRVLCEGDTYPVLDGGAGNASYEWKVDNINLSTSRTVTADKSGLYSVKVKIHLVARV
ncbi:MAG: hypothetical protein IPO92_17895 [Saprospiraceae bacterium]|nr:hypothetical protein [Saprospiraceae bacterium]